MDIVDIINNMDEDEIKGRAINEFPHEPGIDETDIEKPKQKKKGRLLTSGDLEEKKDGQEKKVQETLNLPEDRKMMKLPNGFVRMEPMTVTESVLSGMRKAALFLACLTILFLLALIPFYAFELYKHGTDRHLIAIFSAGAFVIITIPISMREIFHHMAHYYMPDVQRYVIRILWMVPIYSVESWLSLRFQRETIYIQTLRECYEAMVMYSFVYYLISLLGNEAEIVNMLTQKDARLGEHPAPIGWCAPAWKMGEDFLDRCKFGVIQYVVIKIAMAAITCVLQYYDLYAEGDFSLYRGYLYVSFITNFSQSWALYVLVKFYHTTSEELAPFRPLGKFMCVKMVVFATFWQSIAVAALWQMGLIPDFQSWKPEDVASGVQDWLICVEMFVFAICHGVSFTYKDYETPEHANKQHTMKALFQSRYYCFLFIFQLDL